MPRAPPLHRSRPSRSPPPAPCRRRRLPAAPAEAPAAPLRFLAAGLAAAALAVAPMAEAKVILVQPEVKNFVSDSPAAKKAVEKKAAAPKAEKKAYKEESGSSGAGFEAFRPLVLPLALAGVAGAGAVAVKVDPEFADLFDSTWSAKDSNATGAGYEVAPGLKDGPFYGGSAAGGAAVKVRLCVAGQQPVGGCSRAVGGLVAAACAIAAGQPGQERSPHPCCPSPAPTHPPTCRGAPPSPPARRRRLALAP